MGIFNKKNIIKLAEEDLSDARLSSQDFTDEATRKRAFVDVLGARLAMKLLFSKKIEAGNLYSMYTIQNVLGHLDIADIYFNNIKIDVRLVFNENEIFIPKSQFRYNIPPDLYLVLALQEDLSSAEMLGFFNPNDLDKSNANKDFYFCEKEKLQKPEDLKKFLNDFTIENKYVPSEDELQRAEALFLSSIDNEISENERSFLFQQLAYNFELREKFVELENFELMSHKSAKEGTVSTDGVLGIVGAQEIAVEDEENLNLETIIFEDNDEIKSGDDFGQRVAEGLIDGAIVAGGAALAAGAIGALAAGSASAITGTSTVNAFSASVDAVANLANGLASVGESVNSDSNLATLDDNNVVNEAAPPEVNELELLTEKFESKLEELEFEEPEADEIEFVFDEADFKAEELDFEVEEPETDAEEPETDAEEPELVTDENEFKAEELDFEVEEPEVELEEPPFVVDEPEFISSELDFELEKPEVEAEETELVIEDTEFKLEELDFEVEAPQAEEIKPIVDENETIADEIETGIEEPVLEPLEEISPIEAVKPITTNAFEELAPLEELPELGLLNELEPIEEPEVLSNLEDFAPIEVAEIKEEAQDSQEDVVDLENFDFGMFDEEKKATPSNITEEHGTEESLVSFDSLMVAETETETEELDEDYFKHDLIETADSEIDENQEDKDIKNITAQVDELLKTVELTDEQKRMLAGEFPIENEGAPVVQIEMPIEQTPAAAAHEAFAELNELNPSPAVDDEEQDLLKALFKKENISSDDELDLGSRSTPEAEAAKKKKIIIAASVAGVMLVSLVVGGISVGGNKDASSFPDTTNTPAISADVPQQNQDMLDMPSNDPTNPTQQGAGSLTEKITGEGQQYTPQPNRDMGQAVSEAFMSEPVSASVSKIAWEVPEELAYNDTFRKYLQSAGKNLKLTLQNDLLLSTELAYSNKMVIDITLTKTGALQASNVVVSSGSKQIDGIVLQSVKETLKYLKMPTSEVSGPSVNATLIINF